MKRMRIVNKTRFIISTSILISLMVFGIFSMKSNAVSSTNIKYNKMYVSKGDTLWSIASQEYDDNAYYEKKDIRDIVYDLKQINHITDGNLQIGQELYIPSI